VLLVVGADPAVVGTAVRERRVLLRDLLGGFQVQLAGASPVRGVVGEEHALDAVQSAALPEVDAAVFDQLLGVDDA
jgi:hypothetical protein